MALYSEFRIGALVRHRLWGNTGTVTGQSSNYDWMITWDQQLQGQTNTIEAPRDLEITG